MWVAIFYLIARRNVAFKAAKIIDAVLSGQCAVLMREVEGGGACIHEAVLEDLNCNADLYVFNQNAS